MTIASFCHDELLSHGPLTLDDLAARAVAAGVTRARDPRQSVGGAIRYGSALELPGEVWVSPRWLLEGRCLTARALPSLDRPDDERGHAWDLALLRKAARSGPLPLVGGGQLSKDSWYGGTWRSDRPLPVAGPGELLCFRGVDGELEVSVVDESTTATLEAARIRRELDALELPARYGYVEVDGAEDVVLRALAGLVVADPTLLQTPVPPLGDLAGTLSAKVDALLDERARREAAWRPPVCVSQWTQTQLGDLAARDGVSPETWVEQVVDDAYKAMHRQASWADVRYLR